MSSKTGSPQTKPGIFVKHKRKKKDFSSKRDLTNLIPKQKVAINEQL